MDKLEKTVVSVLEGSKEGLRLVEIAQKAGLPEKKVFKILRKLFENGVIDCDKSRRYTLSKESNG